MSEEEIRVCGHTIMAPVQPYRRGKRGKWVPVVGGAVYAPIMCMQRVIGHAGDHEHTFQWSDRVATTTP